MKTITLIVPLMVIGFVASSAAYGQTNSLAFATSPNHPNTWVVGASNIHQALRWNEARQMLVADVTYSTQSWADSVHPAEQEEYTLPFPSVRLDKSSGALMAGRTQVGRISHGFFGSGVELSRNAELDVHRHHGRIFAAINPRLVNY